MLLSIAELVPPPSTDHSKLDGGSKLEPPGEYEKDLKLLVNYLVTKERKNLFIFSF